MDISRCFQMVGNPETEIGPVANFGVGRNSASSVGSLIVFHKPTSGTETLADGHRGD